MIYTYTLSISWSIPACNTVHYIHLHLIHQLTYTQGVWINREIQLTRPALPYDYTCFADGTSFVKEIFVPYRVNNNIFWIFLIQMEYRLQRMHNHMVGRAASVLSPSYSIFLAYTKQTTQYRCMCSILCLFVCLYVWSELLIPFTNLSQFFTGELDDTTEMCLAWFKRFKLRRSTFVEKT